MSNRASTYKSTQSYQHDLQPVCAEFARCFWYDFELHLLRTERSPVFFIATVEPTWPMYTKIPAWRGPQSWIQSWRNWWKKHVGLTNLSTEIVTLTFKPPSTWVAVSKSNLFWINLQKVCFSFAMLQHWIRLQWSYLSWTLLCLFKSSNISVIDCTNVAGWGNCKEPRLSLERILFFPMHLAMFCLKMWISQGQPHIQKRAFKCVQCLPKYEHGCKIGPIAVRPGFVAKRRKYAALMCCCCCCFRCFWSCYVLIIFMLPIVVVVIVAACYCY